MIFDLPRFDEEYFNKIHEAISFTKLKLLKLQTFVNDVFDEADKEKKGSVSTEHFLKSFQIQLRPDLEETFSLSSEQEINKDQALRILCRLVIRNDKVKELKDLNSNKFLS